ncbi:MAG: TetR/AcrR family transcriptional regulator [Micropruina sp.]|uniref:TetR/AcrR family transcriptional regulator n=1 Tax=Micropruina sp. TaxID=2737536 RepID=UPI0039E3A430
MTSAARPAPGVRDAIIRATTELIRDKGVGNTSISDIVARSGTSAGAIYHHFGNKERLILAVGESILAKPMTMVLQTNPELSPAGLLEAALGHVTRDRQTPELLLQIWAGAKADPALGALVRGEVATARLTVRNFIAGWCARHAPQADPDALADLVMALVAGYAVQRAFGIAAEQTGLSEPAKRLLESLGEPG